MVPSQEFGQKVGEHSTISNQEQPDRNSSWQLIVAFQTPIFLALERGVLVSSSLDAPNPHSPDTLH